MSGYRVAARTVPDDKSEPVVVYLVPVDARGRKTGPQLVGTMSRARAGELELGQVLKAKPTLGAFTPPPKRPEPVE